MNHSNIILTGGPAHIPAARSRGLALGRRTTALLILVIGGRKLEEIATIFSNYIFPVAVCIYLFYREQRTSEVHKEEVDTLRDALVNNTLVLQKLVDKLEVAE